MQRVESLEAERDSLTTRLAAAEERAEGESSNYAACNVQLTGAERRIGDLDRALREQRERVKHVVERGPEWHAERFPTATVEHVALKLAEEAGEVCAAVIALAGNEHPERAASVVDECADVFIVLSVLVGRYFPFTPLMEAVQTKLATLASLPPVADERTE
jgi:NTP pyrophosphatase (non-canonical NTP hydrolase)